MQKITPSLWFNDNAEEAVDFYVSVFKDSCILNIMRYSDAGAKVSGMKEGSVWIISFRVMGQEFLALNGGPHFSFTPAISFIVDCETQQEVDRYWKALSKGGEIMRCGWLKDRFGVTWQIVPSIVKRYMAEKDEKKRERVMEALFRMKKIEITRLERAYDKG